MRKTVPKPLLSTAPRPRGPRPDRSPRTSEQSAYLFQAIANFTYDWETWVGTDGRARWINPAVQRITGYSVAECLAMPDYPLPLVHPDDRPEIARRLAEAAEGASGNEHREAERANLAKSRFLAAASHDLRQPIQAAAMFTTALKSAQDPATRAPIIESIGESLRATDDLLNALLDVSRLDAGVLQPRIRAFAIADVLERMELEYRGLASEKRLRLRIVQSSATVLSDPILVERMVGNLVSNALRYCEAGSILIGCRRRGEHLSVEVWDSGVGIDEQDLDVIFEEFRQLGNPERDRTRGLGLGLAIVRRLSQLLDHRVTVRSRKTHGSVFAIDLPTTSAAIEERIAETLHSEPARLADRFVVAIDDDPVQLSAMRAVFGQWHCDIITADTADAALAQLALRPNLPDVIIADYRLRGSQTGDAAIRRLQERLGRPIPSVILTGDTEPARLSEAAASGYEILHKPVRPEDLQRTLQRLLSPRPTA